MDGLEDAASAASEAPLPGRPRLSSVAMRFSISSLWQREEIKVEFGMEGEGRSIYSTARGKLKCFYLAPAIYTILHDTL